MVEERIIGKEPTISKIFKLIKKIVVIIIELILVFIIVFNTWNFISVTFFDKESSDFLGYKTYTIISGSMEPTIRKNSFILVKHTGNESIEKGDIITFVKDGQIITHRVVEIKNDDGKNLYVTKGDNNNTEDTGFVEENMIEGKYITTISLLGKLSIFMTTLSGKIALIAIPVVLILIEYLKISNKKYQSEQRYIKRLKYNAEKLENEEKNT